MSRAVSRRFRVRFAQRGSVEVDASTVDFVLDIDDLAEAPVVAGSFVHPLDGATELRPLHVLAIDRAGALIDAFTAEGRWAALGRLLDIQWQDAADDPYADAWTTYGTGRCSGLDEQDGPGRFRVEISDESWTARRGRVFTAAGTASLWPPGRLWGKWKGYGAATGQGASADDITSSGELFKIRLVVETVGSPIEFPTKLIDYIKSLALPPDELDFTTVAGTHGNFRHLVLRYPNDNDVVTDWPIVSFGALNAGAMYDGIEEPTIVDNDPDYSLFFDVWIRGRGIPFVDPKGGLFLEEDFAIYAPNAPPHESNPLHVGMVDIDAGPAGTILEASIWSGNSGSEGFLHVADLTRRIWDQLAVRYDSSELDALEADTSLPAVAVRITETPDDPEKWAQDFLWGPLMLLALKDAQGRRKLKDLRPPVDDSDIDSLPVLDASNSKGHRWRLVGSELLNSIIWEYETLGVPNTQVVPRLRYYTTVDGFTPDTKSLPAIEGDTTDIALRERAFKAFALLADPATPQTVKDAAAASNAGQPFIGDVVTAHTNLLLGVYQDGPVQGTCEISGSLAETLEEGDHALVDCGSVKIANAATADRTGHVRVLILSLTRHPAHADVEYLVVRTAFVWTCGEPLWSPLDEHGTIRIALPESTESESFTITVDAAKNAAGGHQIDMVVALYEGTAEIASWTETDVSEVEATYSFVLTVGEIAAISVWSNLFLEITRAGDTGGAASTHRRLIVSDFGAG